MRNRLITMLACTVAVLLLPAGALASDAEYEPNDGIHQAYGPLEANTNYDGTTSSSSDDDWYIFYVSGPGLVEVKLTAKDCCVDATLYDQDGTPLNSVSEVESGKSETIPYTTPGPGRYYVSARGGTGDEYTLRVSGSLTSGPRPGPPEVTPNNNPDMASAFGPLLGGTLYGGSIDAFGEEDWFYFYTAGAGAFDVAFTAIDCCPEITLFDGAGERLTRVSELEGNRIGHLRYTAPGPGKFLLGVAGGASDHYQFRIDPASLITSVAPPSVSPPPQPSARSRHSLATAACRKARRTRKKVFAGFKKAQRKRAIAKRKGLRAGRPKARRNWRKSKRRWAKAAKKRRKALTKANRRMKRLCA